MDFKWKKDQNRRKEDFLGKEDPLLHLELIKDHLKKLEKNSKASFKCKNFNKA